MKLHHMILIVFCCVLLGSNSFGAQQQHTVLQEIEDIISDGESASHIKYEAIREEIEQNPDEILPLLVSKASDSQLPQYNLAVYIWAMGLTKSPNTVDEIIKLSTGKDSELVVGNTYRALATIGGEKAGKYLLTQLEQTSNQKMRYNILDLLAQIQYKPALQKADYILAQDPGQYYWQTIFVFGKFGDTAVPFLLEKIEDNNSNVKANAIMVLGQWLIPTEAVTPFKNQFWRESNPKIQGMILSALEKTNPNLPDIYEFSQEVISKEANEHVKRFAQETINYSDKMKKHVEEYRAKKSEDPTVFNSEYNKILTSFGKEGDYEKLAASSTKDDEAKLKKLKETILQRNSDECFDDYQKVNDIIILNRLI